MKRHVVIVGGGVAGLEALMALHDLAGERAELTLVAPDPDFVYKPLLVEEPFDLGPTEQHALAPPAEELAARFVQRGATGSPRRSTTAPSGNCATPFAGASTWSACRWTISTRRCDGQRAPASR